VAVSPTDAVPTQIHEMRRKALVASWLTVIAVGACGGSDERKAASRCQPGIAEPGMAVDEIAFTREGSGRHPDFYFDIYVMNADGSEQTNLTRTPNVDEGTAAWSPDGRRIAFTRSDNQKTADIWVMNANGCEQRRLTDTPKIYEDSPAWSPDGRRIAFHRSTLLAGGVNDIYVVDANGDDVAKLTKTTNAYEGAPAWSPDGQQIAFGRTFVTKHDPSVGIYVMNADGSNQRLLTRGPVFDDVIPALPTFSPDGQQIAFLGLREGDQAKRIWLINADSSNPTPIRAAHSGLGSSPSFSPDGQRIAFEGYPPPGISVIGVDGSNLRALTYNRPNERDPAWSPVPAR
jgi:Tol biopolymer transport system component